MLWPGLLRYRERRDPEEGQNQQEQAAQAHAQPIPSMPYIIGAAPFFG
jgi:hypothetical protein